MNRHHSWPLIFIVVASLFNGCNSEGTRPVTGTVTMDDKPLGGVMVTYYPIGGGRTNSIAETNDQGQYTLRYSSKSQGAIPGKYKVLISKTKMMPNGEEQELLPARYNTKSELEREINSSGQNEFNFELTSEE